MKYRSTEQPAGHTSREAAPLAGQRYTTPEHAIADSEFPRSRAGRRKPVTYRAAARTPINLERLNVRERQPAIFLCNSASQKKSAGAQQHNRHEIAVVGKQKTPARRWRDTRQQITRLQSIMKKFIKRQHTQKRQQRRGIMNRKKKRTLL